MDNCDCEAEIIYLSILLELLVALELISEIRASVEGLCITKFSEFELKIYARGCKFC